MLVANCCKIAKRFRGCIAHGGEDNALLELINTTAERRRTSANINLVFRRPRVHPGGVKAVLALTTLLAASQIAEATIASGDAAKHVGERPQ
jgi:hypothetical protein